jgi:hypothetical protein
MKKKVNEGLEMDMTTYKKVKGTIDPKTPIKITGDKPAITSTATSTMEEDVNPEATIEPQDDATIKYLSNVKDAEGNVSKPFNIGGKNYQMIRGIKPSKEVVMAVYCHDDINENGENCIHEINYFEENIANPAKMQAEQSQPLPVKEVGGEFESKDAFMDYLNLADVQGFKHFFVNIKTGVITEKFKKTGEMMKSGKKLGPDEDYMDEKALKRFRLGTYFKKEGDVNEEDATDETPGTNINKLQADVKKLATLIKNKFSIYLSKLDKPIEQAQFLTAMAAEIGVPLNKLSSIMSSYKDIAQTQAQPTAPAASVAESKILTKNQLIESLKVKKINKIIKVKDIK